MPKSRGGLGSETQSPVAAGAGCVSVSGGGFPMVPLEAVAQWGTFSNRHYPYSINYQCPLCGQLVTFTLAEPNFDSQRNTISATARCPNCRERVRFWVIDPIDAKQQGSGAPPRCRALWMYPPLTLRRDPMKGLNQIPPEIRKFYIATITEYNSGHWDATAVLCGKVLEGILERLLPEDARYGTLAQQVRALGEKVDLHQPLTNLADALREGRNLAAHFDLSVETDRSIADQMVDLLEYLLEYLFVLPANVAALREALKGEDKEEAAS